jgi:hypothetical protein
LLVDNANLYPRTDQFYDFTGPFAQAAVLIKKLLGNLAEERREILTRDVLSQPTLLVFAIECWDWMRTRKEDEPKAPPFLRVEFEKEVGDLLAARLRASWLERPFYQYPRMEAQKLLFSWLRLCGRGETNVALGLRFILQTSDAITLLRVLSSVPVSMSTGLELPATFGRENYNNLKQLVDPEVIFNAIELLPARTGKPAAEEEFTERADSEDRVTDRFLHVYAIASAHSATESQPDSVTELD